MPAQRLGTRSRWTTSARRLFGARLPAAPTDRRDQDRSLLDHGGRPTGRNRSSRSRDGVAHSLAIKVVAQGVETQAQLSFLQEAGCDTIQGYLISPPRRRRRLFDDPTHTTAAGPYLLPSPANTARGRPQSRRKRPSKIACQVRAKGAPRICPPLGGPGSTGSSNEVAVSPYICLTSFHAAQPASIAALRAMGAGSLQIETCSRPHLCGPLPLGRRLCLAAR